MQVFGVIILLPICFLFIFESNLIIPLLLSVLACILLQRVPATFPVLKSLERSLPWDLEWPTSRLATRFVVLQPAEATLSTAPILPARYSIWSCSHPLRLFPFPRVSTWLPLQVFVSPSSPVCCPLSLYALVYSNIVTTAHLKKGESYLVHGGTSGIGTSSIQVHSSCRIDGL